MPVGTTIYKGLSILDTGPVEAGGILIIDDFKELADRIGPCIISVNAPTVNDDGADTGGIGKALYVGSRWYQIQSGSESEWVCLDNSTGAAIWKATGGVAALGYTGFTTGSVVFVNSSGQITQDNTNFFWDDTNNRLGVGTNSPSFRFDVLTDAVSGVTTLDTFARFSSAARYPTIKLNATRVDNEGQPSLTFAKNDVGLFAVGSDYAANGTRDFFIYDVPDGANRLYITAAGNVGINHNSPSRKLTVDSASEGRAALFTSASHTSLELNAATGFNPSVVHKVNSADKILVGYNSSVTGSGRIAGSFEIYSFAVNLASVTVDENAPAHSIRVASNGNVGIGTDTVNASFHVKRTGATSEMRVEADTGQIAGLVLYQGASNFFELYKPAGSSDLRLFDGTTLSDMMTFEAGGNVGIGTTNPVGKLDVQGSLLFNTIGMARSGTLPSLPVSLTALFYGYDSGGDRAFFSSGSTDGGGSFSTRKPLLLDCSTFTVTRDGSTADFEVDSAGNTAVINVLTVSKRIRAGYDVSSTSSGTFSTDASLANTFFVLLENNTLLENPTNPVPSQRITWVLKQDASGNRTLTFDSDFRFGTSLPTVTLSTAADITDYLTAIYNGVDSKWDVVGFVKGF